MSQRDLTAKLLIIGNSGVGKTNILLKFTANTFVMSHITTIGTSAIIKESISNQKQFWYKARK
jgi:GTPase SAR1 family protein